MFGTLALPLLATLAFEMPCESLRSASTPQVAISSAEVVPAGPFVQPGGGQNGSAPAQPAAAIP